MLLKQERKSFHRQVAETLQRVYAGQLDNYAALLTQHFTEAGDDAKTIEYGIRAGDVAMRLYTLIEARAHYTHALGALDLRLPDNDENARMRMETLGRPVNVSRFADEPSRNLARLDEAEAIAKRLLESDQSVRGQLVQIYHWKGSVDLIPEWSREALYYFRESGALPRALGDAEYLRQRFMYMQRQC